MSLNSHAQLNDANSDGTGSVLLVDVSAYSDERIPTLRSNGRGIYEIREALLSVGGYLDNQVFMMTGEKSSREGITATLTNIIDQLKSQDNKRFFLYLKARYMKIGNEIYLLPYDARTDAISTYIKLSEIRSIWNSMGPAKEAMRAYILALWDMAYQDEEYYSSNLADVLSDERTDADGDRNITFYEINKRLVQISSRKPELQVITDSSSDASAPLMRLSSVVEVLSEPVGANVFVDNINKGLTPLKITDLAQGEHRLSVRKELYRQSEERIFSLSSVRGQRIGMAKYQLMPIRILGSVMDADQNPIANAEVWIDGTEYRQKVEDDGKFSIESSQLEQGKSYNISFRSLDNIYSGRTSFVFKGMDDISLSIAAVQGDWITLAQQRFRQGDQEGALGFLDRAIQMTGTVNAERFEGIQEPLALLFLANLDEKLQSEPNNLKLLMASAILSDIIGDTRMAKSRWKAIKGIAPKDSDEYKQANMRLSQLSLIRKPWMVAIISFGILILIGGLIVSLRYIARWTRFRRFREIPNPYIAGKPIIEPGMFFGREDIFSFIKEKFSRNAKDITIVLYGGRRTGKTSIMYQIANGRLGQDFVPVFIDMQEMAGVDAHDFFRSIAQKVDRKHTSSFDISDEDRGDLDQLLGDLDDKGKSAYQSFNKYITTVASMMKDSYLIFLIDEYELLEDKVSDGDLTDEIFTYLRHLMQNINNLAFIFSGSRDFARRERKEWSLMFNMAQPKEVSFLSHENAIALITVPVKDYVQYDRKAIDRILRLTSAHPFFVQALCLRIIEELNERQQNKINIEQVQRACNDIVENAPFHLPYVWNELNDDGKILTALLAEVIQDGESYIPPDEVMPKMPEYGLKYDLPDVNKIIAQLMEEQLIEKKPEQNLYRFQMDLIREWVRVEHPVWGVLREVKTNE